MPILQDNIASNRALLSKCTPEAAVLDWDDAELAPPVQVQLEAGLDVIVYVALSSSASYPMPIPPQHGRRHLQHRVL